METKRSKKNEKERKSDEMNQFLNEKNDKLAIVIKTVELCAKTKTIKL